MLNLKQRVAILLMVGINSKSINLSSTKFHNKIVIGRLSGDFEWRKPWDTFDKLRGQH